MKKSEKFMTILGALLMIYVFVSFIDVITHNQPWQDHVYHAWNLFTILFRR